MASEKEAPRPDDRARLSAVRFLLPLGFLALLIILGFIASSSCVLATRDLPEAGPDSEVAAPPPPVDASEGGAMDVNNDCGCCVQNIEPLLPYCSGQVAFAISAADCRQQTCADRAYALCQGGCFTVCVCALPAGYTLQGSLVGDGGAPDGGGLDAVAGASGG
jgi:hypothetical protein